MKTVVLLAFLALHSSACSDFVVFLNGGNTQRSAESTKELANSLATQLELDQRVHRVALTRSDYVQALRDWQPSPLSSTSKGLESRLEQVLRQATTHRRMNVALTVILLDDDGSSAFNTNPSAFGVFGEFVRKKHYIYVLIVSKKAERIRTSLDLSSEEVETGSNRDELRLIASPFTRCQIRLANELRRKPLPRLSKVNSDSRIVSKSDDQQTTIVDLRPVTVPVSVHFPTTTIRSTIKTTSQSTITQVSSTTIKPRKLGCQFDVVILFDLSGNSFDKLQRYQQMTIDLIRQSELGEHAARFSLIRYSGPKRTDVLFHLNKHSNRSNLIKGLNRIMKRFTFVSDIESVQVMGGTTRTKEAMEFALREFEPKFGGRDRNEAQRHMIVFTDGHSQDDPADVADQLNKQRVHVFAVAVDDFNIKPDLEQLRLISSDSKSALLDAQFGKPPQSHNCPSVEEFDSVCDTKVQFLVFNESN
ncbi:hypothetical protein M3Y96_00617100 [Aphelenchoides besseyi]|nr:hypothetical protein M3Y96_00617100 [Aphelenchoides besseyi]